MWFLTHIKTKNVPSPFKQTKHVVHAWLAPVFPVPPVSSLLHKMTDRSPLITTVQFRQMHSHKKVKFLKHPPANRPKSLLPGRYQTTLDPRDDAVDQLSL